MIFLYEEVLSSLNGVASLTAFEAFTALLKYLDQN